MEAIRFINNYELYIDEIRSVVKSELFPIIEELRGIDPHDLVSPESWFQDEANARGFVWSIFLNKVGAKNVFPTIPIRHNQ